MDVVLLGLSLNERFGRRQKVKGILSPETELVFVAIYLTDITYFESKSCNCGVELSCTEDCQVNLFQLYMPLKELSSRNIIKNAFSKLWISI